jgi:hypothetical protein
MYKFGTFQQEKAGLPLKPMRYHNKEYGKKTNAIKL